MKTQSNLQDPDDFYERLLDAYEGLTPDEAQQFDARLILLLANQVGDAKVLADCVAAAREIPEGKTAP